MGCLNKRAKHLKAAREAKRQRTPEPEVEERGSVPFTLLEAHWEGISSDEEESEIEMSEPEDNILGQEQNTFEILLNAEKEGHSANFLYQRGSELSDRQQRRIRAAEKDLFKASQAHSQPITKFFAPTTPTLNNSPKPDSHQLRQAAIHDLQQKLKSKKSMLEGQNLTRHRAVLQLLNITQMKKDGETREDLSYSVARGFNRGKYFARRIIEWEGIWIRERYIPEGKQGCFAKSFSWYNDEGVQIAVREWCASTGDSKLKNHLTIVKFMF